MTRVLLVSQLPPPVHGSTVMTQRLLDVMGELEIETHLVDRRFSRVGSEIGRFSLRKSFAAVSLFFRLGHGIRRFKPDRLIFFLTNRGLSFFVDLILCVLLRATDVRVIHYIHTSGFSRLAGRSRIHGWAVRFVLETAESLVVLSNSLSLDVLTLTRKSLELKIVPNYVSIEGPRSNFNRGKSGILFFSNVIPGKGAEDFIAIAKGLKNKGQIEYAVIAGEASEASYLKLLKSKLSESDSRFIHFYGAVRTDFERAKLLSECSLLIFPSTYEFEAQPLVLIEAMACGTPILAYAQGAVPDMIENGINGWTVKPGDSLALLQVASQVLRDSIALEKMSKGALDVFVTQYSKECFRTNIKELLIGSADNTPRACKK